MKTRIPFIDLVVCLVVVNVFIHQTLWYGLGERIPLLGEMAVRNRKEQERILMQVEGMLTLFAQNEGSLPPLRPWQERLADLRSHPPALRRSAGDPRDVWSHFQAVAYNLSVQERHLAQARGLRDEVWETFQRRFRGPVVMRISEDVLRFPTAQAVPVDSSPLGGIFAGALRRVREGYSFISVEAHCDNQPIRTAPFPSNWELSHARALFLTKRLQGYLQERGLRPGIDFVIGAAGFGEWCPIASNDAPQGRSRNRRLEIVFFKRPLVEEVAS